MIETFLGWFMGGSRRIEEGLKVTRDGAEEAGLCPLGVLQASKRMVNMGKSLFGGSWE